MKYIIRVKGHLDPFWQEWFENLSITHEKDGTTRLSGLIPNRAALYGILLKMCDLGLTLLFLEASMLSSSQSLRREAKQYRRSTSASIMIEKILKKREL